MVSAREARLGRAVEQLRRRLEQSRAEVAQLEALLRDADAQATGEPACVRAGPEAAGASRPAPGTRLQLVALGSCPMHQLALSGCPACVM